MSDPVPVDAARTTGVPWRRLDPRMLVVGPLTNLAQLLPVVVIVLLTGRSGGLDQVGYAVGGAVKIAGLDARDAAELARTLTETTQATPGDAT